MNFDDFKYNEKKLPVDYQERLLLFDELRKDTINEMKASIENKDFFKDYSEEEVDAFILEYAKIKADNAQNYKYRINNIKDKQLKLKVEAEMVYSLIKQKQLYNIQLKWRAEELKIEGVEYSQDFLFLSRNINECWFLPEVSDYEVKLLKDFILGDEFYSDSFFSPYLFQSYDMFKMEDSNNPFIARYPRWYTFYDERLGTGSLLMLPNIRGEKENIYIIARNDQNEKEYKQKQEEEIINPTPKPAPPPPKLNESYDYKMSTFANLFEDDIHIKELFRLFDKQISFDLQDKEEENEIYNENDISDEYIDDVLYKLDDIEELLAMESVEQWREALITLHEDYMCKKIESFIDIIHEENQMFAEMGLLNKRSKEALIKAMHEDPKTLTFRNHILEGRKALGEPMNFDF